MGSNRVGELKVPDPQGSYVPATRIGQMIRTAGMTPRRAGQLIVTGRVGAELDVRQARQAAALAVCNAIVAARSLIREGEALRCAALTVYIACTDDFAEHSSVADGASDFICAHLGTDNLPARSAVGVYTLPGGSPVEVALVAEAASTE